jgi:hypothetical protein
MRRTWEPGNWMFDVSEEWSEWFSDHWNWRNFTFIKIYYEDEICMGSRELDLAFLGLGLRIVYLYNREAPTRVLVTERMDEWLAKNDSTADTSSGSNPDEATVTL